MPSARRSTSIAPSERRVRGPLAVLGAAALAALGALFCGPLSACNGDAVGVAACTQIEQKRCELAPTCAGKNGAPNITTDVEIANCKDLYRDHCLVGIENTAGEPSDGQVTACLDALQATIDCQKGGVSEMSACAAAPVDDGSLAPCAAFESPEHLTACHFIASTTTAATTTTTTTTTTTSTTTSSTTSSTGTGG